VARSVPKFTLHDLLYAFEHFPPTLLLHLRLPSTSHYRDHDPHLARHVNGALRSLLEIERRDLDVCEAEVGEGGANEGRVMPVSGVVRLLGGLDGSHVRDIDHETEGVLEKIERASMGPGCESKGSARLQDTNRLCANVNMGELHLLKGHTFQGIDAVWYEHVHEVTKHVRKTVVGKVHRLILALSGVIFRE
jgi:hypothetical protein